MAEVQKNKSDKIAKLKKYEEHIRHRLASAIPARHKGQEEQFKFWLNNELKRTLRSIELLGS